LYLDTINQEEKFPIGNISGTQKLRPEPCTILWIENQKQVVKQTLRSGRPYRAEEVARPLLTAGIFLSRAVPT
jgi:hypothetical protein